MLKTKSLLFALFALFPLSSDLFADELTDIQEAIKQKGAQWVAGETSMTRLTPEERKLRLMKAPLDATGKVLPPASLEADSFLSSPQAYTAAPASFDWRNNNGNYITSVKNQRQCGACWAFSTTAALESYTLIQNHTPGVDLDLSEQTLISCSGNVSCSGGNNLHASDYITRSGLPLETCYPYTAKNDSCGNACAEYDSATTKIGKWITLPMGEDQIKRALTTWGPVVAGMHVYTDFFSYSGGIYSYAKGVNEGNHSILIIGYDDVGQYFIAKNSWGTGWGEQGFFRIAYSERWTVLFGYDAIAYINDNIPPAVSLIINSGDESTNSRAVTLELSCMDADNGCTSSFTVSNDNFETYPTSYELVSSVAWTLSPGNGVKTVSARFCDTVQNCSYTSDTIMLDAGGPVPETTITEKPDNPANSRTATFGFMSNEEGSTFRCSLGDGSLYTYCTSPKSYTGLWDGTHTFRVKAVNSISNVDLTPAIYTWVIDTTPPTLNPSAEFVDSTHIDIFYSEAVKGAATVSNYTADNGLAITEATAMGENAYRLTTSRHEAGISYSITANNITDLAGNALGANNTAFLRNTARISVVDSIPPSDDLQIISENVAVGAFSDQTVTVTNKGNADMFVGSIALADPLSFPFSIQSDTCSGKTLPPSGNCSLSIRFTSNAPGTFDETFDIPSNDPVRPVITMNVHGTGVSSSAGSVSLSAPQLVFPEKGQTGLGQTVMFRWTKSADPNKEIVAYKLSYCDNQTFEGCVPVNASVKGAAYASIGFAGVAFLGFIIGQRKSQFSKWRIGLVVGVIIISSLIVNSCGRSNTKALAADEMKFQVSNLRPGTTYYWKVSAENPAGDQVESEVRSFSTGT